jgi:hypothetical protein
MKYYRSKTTGHISRVYPNGYREVWLGDHWKGVSLFSADNLKDHYVEISKQDLVKLRLKGIV